MPLTYRIPRIVALLFFAATSCAASCTSQNGSRPETAIVHGSVTYHGAPVADARVVFMRAGAPRFASGQTDAAGHFDLTTFAPGDGAVVGKNAVIVVKRVTGSGSSTENVDPSTANNSDLDAAFDRAAKSAPAKSAIPAKYANEKTSGLERKVVRGENNFDIQLTE